MKKGVIYFLIAATLGASILPSASLNAQGAADRQAGVSGAAGVQLGGGSQENVQTAASAGTTSGLPPAKAAEGDGCGVTNPGQCFMDIVLLLPGYLALTILKIAQWLTHISGMMLNYVVYYTIVKMKANMSNAQMLNDAWKTIRDVGNMGFIFILLYAAIKTIIGQGGDNQKLVARVVVVAILINFSLFFTRFIIDISNVLAITFYDAIAPGALDSTFTKGLSASLMEPLRLQSIFDVSSGLTIFSGEKIFIIGVAGTIFSLIAAFVFFAISLFLIIRFVVLVFVLILSPIAFLAMIMPQMKGYATQWWNALSGQAFFAPIYFLLTWVVIVVSRSLLKQGSFANLAGVDTPGGGTTAPPVDTIAMIMNFSIMIAMLVFSLVAAKDWANKAGPGVAGATKWAMGRAGAMSFGLASRAGRYTLGAAAEKFSDSEAYKKLEREAPNSMRARLKLAVADRARTSSFDARSAGIGSLLQGANAGQAIGKGGFEADKKNFREFLEKPGTESYKKRQERARKAGIELDILENHEKVARIEEIEREVRLSGVMTPAQAEELDKLTNKYKIERIEAAARATGVMTPAQAEELDKLKEEGIPAEKLEEAITKATAKEIEVIVDSNRKLLESQEFANRLSTQQLEALNKSDKFSEQEKEALKKSRFAHLESFNDAEGVAALAVPASSRNAAQIEAVKKIERARKAIKGLSDSEIEMIDPEWLKNEEFVNQLRQPQVDSLIKSSRFTSTQKDSVRTYRRKPLIEALRAGSATDVAKIIKKTDPKVLVSYLNIPGERGVNLAYEPEVLSAYTPEILKRMAGDMTQEDIDKLRNALLLGPSIATPLGRVTTPAANPKTAAWLVDRGNGKGVDRFS